jgi:hypothetical protein
LADAIATGLGADTTRPVDDASETRLHNGAGAARPLYFVNIAGGPAIDSLNAILLVHREHPTLLASRDIVIGVLDGDLAGPAFGARALAAWLGRGGPLEGLGVTFRHWPYDWNRPESLAGVLDEARKSDAFVVASSEGGLFEYGSDDDIARNLVALRSGAPGDFAMVGSVTRADAPIRRLRETSHVATIPRGLAPFRALAGAAGFDVLRAIERPFSDHVLIAPRKGG